MVSSLTRLLRIFLKSSAILALWGLSLAHAELRPTELSYFGMHIHGASTGTAWPPIRFGSWRLWDARVSWSRLEPQPGKWDFTTLDSYMVMARITGVEVLFPLGLTPTWASARPTEESHYEKGNASEPRDMSLWRNYVRTVAERYKGRITHYEIWNEVNDRKFYSGSPEILVKLTCEANRILKDVDPKNTLASPSVTEVGKHLKWHDDFLRLDGARCVDSISHHFYATNDEPEGMIPKIRAVRQLLTKWGIADFPLWNTETGWQIANADGTPTTSAFLNSNWKRFEAADSDWLVARALLLARGEGVERFYWYSWDHSSLGLIEPHARTLKPGARAFDRVARWMVNLVITPCQQQGKVWSCALYKDGHPAGWIAWAPEGTGQFKWPGSDARVSVEYLDGSDETINVKSNQNLPVTKRPGFFKLFPVTD